MMRKAQKQKAPPTTRACDAPGCTGAGEFRAPRSKSNLREHYWFCLEHVRAYNQSWDYFAGMNQTQIEAFMKDALTGHRPTWKTGDRTAYDTQDLDAALRRMMGEEPHNASPQRPRHDNKTRKALAILDMEEENVTLQTVKARYKELVKRFHPDVNNGNKQKEEHFKLITGAYKFLMQELKPSV